MTTEDNDKGLFEILSKDPMRWLEHSKQMMYSADVILNNIVAISNIPQSINEIRVKKLGYFNCYYLLVGFAFENLLKGILIKKKPEIIQDNRLISKNFKAGRTSHNLLMMSDQINLELNYNEKTILKMLYDSIRWASRYPIPIEGKDYNEKSRILSLDRDRKIIRELFNKYEKILIESII